MTGWDFLLYVVTVVLSFRMLMALMTKRFRQQLHHRTEQLQIEVNEYAKSLEPDPPTDEDGNELATLNTPMPPPEQAA